MSTTRIATLIAILGGSLLGSLAAALSVAYRPAPIPASGDHEPPFETVAATAPPASQTTTRDRSKPEPPSAPAAAPSAPVTSSKTTLEIEGPLPSWLEDPLPADPEAVTKAAVSCARGNAIDCMRAGDSYDAGRGVQPNERQARLNRVAGARLFERACKKRDPDACYSLSVIYSMGLGVKRNPEIAQGHMIITQRLCRSVPADLCKRLPKTATE